MSRSKQRADRIRAEIPIAEVLASYGYQVDGASDREQQFRCDLHGDGNDGKPSARVYPDEGHWYCFACARSRDAIQTVREKEGLEFSAACSQLEQRFKLPPLPWVEDDKPDWESALERPTITATDAHARASRVVESITREKSLPLPAVLLAWERLDEMASRLEQDTGTLLDEFNAFRVELIDRLRNSSS
jgi:DNA primase